LEKQIPYGLKITFLIHFVVAVVFGLAFFFLTSYFGGTMGAPFREFTRLVGAALIAFAAGSWFAYRETVWERVKIVVQMEIVFTILGVLAVLYGLIFEGLPTEEGVSAVILGAFAVAFIFFYSRRQ
jgi:hypothetical protein